MIYSFLCNIKHRENENINSKSELLEIVKEIGEAPFRANQIWHWLYYKGCKSFHDMTDLSNDLRIKLAEEVHIPRLKIQKELMSRDGTIKWLLSLQ